MTAAKVVDITANLLDSAGHAADAVSACAQVRMEDVPKIAQISKVTMAQKA